mmetsp:Transcript_70578/g.188371  ORF Transcript_70578/g.188371 Transcript_70578/m.188371 type:complete len:281 (-) Transcript_70578:405-1247(-)
MSRKRASSCSARTRCCCDSSTCSTMGNSSGLPRDGDPSSSHTSKAVSWSPKKLLDTYSARGSRSSRGSWAMQTSAARSQACQSGWWWEGGSAGTETGVQPSDRRMRWARMKLRKMDATSRSWRKRRLKRSGGSRFQAMVSVTAVKIQLSSPSTVLRSLSLPGTWSASSGSIRVSGAPFWHSQRRAILCGVVRQAVKTSAGSDGFCGSVSPALHAARRMWSSSRCCGETSTPALEQSKTRIEGLPSHVWRSYTLSGMYWVKFLLNTHISLFEVGLGTPRPL